MKQFVGELGDDELIPALGESWSHSCSSSIHLDFRKGGSEINANYSVKDTVRELRLSKSPRVMGSKSGGVYFCVTKDGIRDIELEELMEV